ncbi:MAG: type II 3-dehydroquinate dehydratase [Fibrobacterota bacterium]
MQKIAVLNGPNINRLGIREPDIYGATTYEDLTAMLTNKAADAGVSLELFQSNHEGELIDTIHRWSDAGVEGVIFNPAAYTHTSIALRDAVSSSQSLFIEVHISNIYKREAFRHTSFTAPVSEGVISGLGITGYLLAMDHLIQRQS